MNVAVCICTFRRPDGLSNLLDHLARLDWEHDLEVFVADNDATGQQGHAIVQSLPADYRWPVSSDLVERQGISFSRNRVVAMALESTPDLVAFLDDDEWPSEQWLKELVRVQQTTDAGAVGGPTLPVFPEGTDAFFTGNPYYGADEQLVDGSQCVLNAAGNFLIRASILEELAPEFFNPEFALTGGEDLAFFYVIQQRGHRMSWAAKAIVHESVPPERLTREWIRSRVVAAANIRVHVMRKYEPGLVSSLVRAVKTAGLVPVSAVMTLAGLFHTPTAHAAQRMRWRFEGKLTAHLKHKLFRDEGR